MNGVRFWSDGREARQGTANPSTRVQIPFPPPLFKDVYKHVLSPIRMKESLYEFA